MRLGFYLEAGPREGDSGRFQEIRLFFLGAVDVSPLLK